MLCRSPGGDDLLAGAAGVHRLSDEERSLVPKAGDVFGTAAMTELWDAALSAPGWDRPPVWFHGDFHTGNLLTEGGRISAVIDFGGLGVGDPAPERCPV
jgi:aminoglycoside phosphotransferase (APT) family kinase protein